jgi:hypothetical protein
LNKCWAVISDKFFNSAPSAEDVFEDKLCEGAGVFGTEQSEFGVGGEGATSMNNIPISMRSQHEHGIDMGFVEEIERGGDRRGDMKMVSESSLALMACLDVPANISVKIGPPESL